MLLIVIVSLFYVNGVTKFLGVHNAIDNGRILRGRPYYILKFRDAIDSDSGLISFPKELENES